MQSYVEEESNNTCRGYQELVKCFEEQCECDFDLFGSDGLPIRTLFIRNASKQTKSSDLEELFSQFGEVLKCDVKWVQNYQTDWKTAQELKKMKIKVNQGDFQKIVTFSSAYDALRARRDAYKTRIVLHNRILELKEASSSYAPACVQKCSTVELVRLNIESPRNHSNTKIDALKDDHLMEIFLHLPILDRIRMERVCRKWRAISQTSWSHVRKLVLLKSTWGLSYESKFKEIDAKMLRNVLQRCGRHLKEIHLSDIFDKTYANPLSDVVEFCPSLQVINASRITVSPVSIELLSQKCQDVKSLSLNRIDGSCEAALTKFFEQSRKLSHFMGCWNLGGECLLHWPRTTIREILLTDSSNLNFDYLTRVFIL